MKGTIQKAILIFGVGVGLITSLYALSIYETPHERAEGLKGKINAQTDTFAMKKINPVDSTRMKRFKKVKRVFSIYNKEISDETINTFLNVCEHYGIGKNEKIFDMFIGQICVESGAQQFTKDGKILKSSGNAIGIGQIVPTTAFFYLNNYIPEADKVELTKRGVGFGFVNTHELTTVQVTEDSTITYVSGKARKKTINWLKNEKNNLYLWGYIMKRNLERFNISETLVAYNRGPAYVKHVPSPIAHKYVKKVRWIVYNRVNEEEGLAYN